MKTKILYFTTLALALASCTREESPTDKAGLSPLQVVAATLMGPALHPSSRALTVAPLTSGSIGVFRSQGTGYIETQDNKQYTYNTSNGWQPSAAAHTVYLMANDADVCAYFPYNSVYTNKTAIPLVSGKYSGTADDLTKHASADICYATNRTMNGSNATTAFEMQHAMAMVQLSFERLNYESDRCNISSISIQNPALVSTATLNITDGTYTTVGKGALTWTPGTGDASTGIQVPQTGTSDPALSVALAVPCTLDAAGTTFNFTVDGKTMSAKLPQGKLPAFEPGKIHKLKFRIHAASIVVEEVSIIDWWKEWASGSEPEFDAGERDYIELSGVRWAVANLEYHPVYHNYSFGTTPAAAGSKLAWNVLTDTDAGSTSTAWDGNNDPCSRLEPKGVWITPTAAQLSTLTSITSAWTTNYNGVPGRWFGTDDATVAAASPEKYLFLPATDAATGNYWSSSYGTAQPTSLQITSAATVTAEAPPASTYAVRCVKR